MSEKDDEWPQRKTMGVTGHGEWRESQLPGQIPTAEDNGQGGLLPLLLIPPGGILIVSRAMSPAVGTAILPQRTSAL